MASLPPRDSRVLQTVDLIQQDILAGALKGDIPGERELSRRLRIGRVTLRSALKILEEKRWISQANAGSRRRTIKRPTKGNETSQSPDSDYRGKIIVTLTPYELSDLPANERLDHARFNSFCFSAGITHIKVCTLSHLQKNQE